MPLEKMFRQSNLNNNSENEEYVSIISSVNSWLILQNKFFSILETRRINHIEHKRNQKT